jgi:hypothetical protein
MSDPQDGNGITSSGNGNGNGNGNNGASGVDSSSSDNFARRRLSRFRSVRKKPTSLGGWRSSVKSLTTASNLWKEDLDFLAKGTFLWKVRRKKLQGVTCYRRKYKVKKERANDGVGMGHEDSIGLSVS